MLGCGQPLGTGAARRSGQRVPVHGQEPDGFPAEAKLLGLDLVGLGPGRAPCPAGAGQQRTGMPRGGLSKPREIFADEVPRHRVEPIPAAARIGGAPPLPVSPARACTAFYVPALRVDPTPGEWTLRGTGHTINHEEILTMHEHDGASSSTTGGGGLDPRSARSEWGHRISAALGLLLMGLISLAGPASAAPRPRSGHG